MQKPDAMAKAEMGPAIVWIAYLRKVVKKEHLVMSEPLKVTIPDELMTGAVCPKCSVGGREERALVGQRWRPTVLLSTRLRLPRPEVFVHANGVVTHGECGETICHDLFGVDCT